VKNKVAPPFRECEFDIVFGHGISREGEVLDLAVELGIIQKGGSWFSYNGTKIGQGRDNAKEYLKNNPADMTAIEKLINEKSGELVFVSKKNKKTAALKAAALDIIADVNETSEISVDVDADDDFEEFTPV